MESPSTKVLFRARYCEYTVANAPKILRMRLNKLPWSHCATWINVRFPPAVCSFLLVPPVVSLVWPMIQNDLFHNLWSSVYSRIWKLPVIFFLHVHVYVVPQCAAHRNEQSAPVWLVQHLPNSQNSCGTSHTDNCLINTPYCHACFSKWLFIAINNFAIKINTCTSTFSF